MNKEIRDEIQKALDAYEEQVAGLPKMEKSSAPRWLNMTLEEIRTKPIDELAEAGFELAQYTLYIQRMINRNRAWEKWAKSKIDEVTAYNIQNISDHYGFNERVIIARNSNDCIKLNSFLRKVQMEIDTLWGVPDQIRHLSDTIKEIRFTKWRKTKDE